MGCGLCKSAFLDFNPDSQDSAQATERLFTVAEEGSDLEESRVRGKQNCLDEEENCLVTAYTTISLANAE